MKKRFLITGGAGFIGSHLAERLLESGNAVDVIDDLSTGSMENVRELLRRTDFNFARAPVEDAVVLDRLSSKNDIIVHLAAAVGVKLIVKQPVRTIETNIKGTEAVLRSALRYGCRVLIASTSEVYGKGIKSPFTEDQDVILGTTDKSRWAYAASKMIDEFLAISYYREFGLEVIPFRLFNTIGPRQTGTYGMVVPTFVRQAMRNDPITVYGDGSQSRCFCDVRDAVEAILALCQDPSSIGRLFNIGTQEEITIRDLAVKIRSMTSSSSRIVTVPYSEAYEEGFEDMQRRVPDTTRIWNAVGWKPKRTLEESLKEIIDHERKMLRI